MSTGGFNIIVAPCIMYFNNKYEITLNDPKMILKKTPTPTGWEAGRGSKIYCQSGPRYGIMVCSGSMSHIINFVFFEVKTTFLKLNLKKLGTIKDSKHYKFTNITLFSSFFV